MNCSDALIKHIDEFYGINGAFDAATWKSRLDELVKINLENQKIMRIALFEIQHSADDRSSEKARVALIKANKKNI